MMLTVFFPPPICYVTIAGDHKQIQLTTVDSTGPMLTFDLLPMTYAASPFVSLSYPSFFQDFEINVHSLKSL